MGSLCLHGSAMLRRQRHPSPSKSLSGWRIQVIPVTHVPCFIIFRNDRDSHSVWIPFSGQEVLNSVEVYDPAEDPMVFYSTHVESMEWRRHCRPQGQALCHRRYGPSEFKFKSSKSPFLLTVSQFSVVRVQRVHSAQQQRALRSEERGCLGGHCGHVQPKE